MCDQVAPIFRAIEFIECHLQENITVAQIAEAAGFSLFHFIRKFNQMVHHTPYDYLMRRRLTEAAKAVISGNQRIIDIAQDYCFNDQETFSRVFRKMFRMTPSQCRKDKDIPLHNRMQAMTIEGLRFINSDHFIPPRVVEEVELHLYGLMTSLDEKAANRANQRERICKDFFSESDFHPQTKVYELELKLNPHHVTPYFYVGVEETFFRRLPSLLVRHVIRAGRFVKIEVIDAEIHLACDYIYSTMIPRLGLTAKNGMTVLHWSLKSDARQRIKTLLIPVE